MGESGGDQDAVRVYERIRDEVAEHRVVDEAEAVITTLWVGELQEMRRAELGLVATVSMAERAALRGLRAAVAAGGPGDRARARAWVELLREEHADGLERARGLIAHVEAELGRVGLVDVERGRRAELDFERLRVAWSGAYGHRGPRRD